MAVRGAGLEGVVTLSALRQTAIYEFRRGEEQGGVVRGQPGQLQSRDRWSRELIQPLDQHGRGFGVVPAKFSRQITEQLFLLLSRLVQLVGAFPQLVTTNRSPDFP